MTFWKFTNTVDEDEDPIFVSADDEASARQAFAEQIGEIPASMLRVEQCEAPDDEDFVIQA